jgi:8-oxo-dGTP pyrophosphatase MutT (NUDIX family)
MMNIPLGNSALIICKENNLILTVDRRENRNLRCLPGGKQEVFENSVDGMLREVYEETGLKFLSTETIPFYSGLCDASKFYWVTTYLIITDYVDSFKPLEKDLSPEWMTFEDFLKLSYYPNYNNKLYQHYKENFKFIK